MKPGKALKILSDIMKRDPDYAWAWHCNLAISLYDEAERDLPMCNRAAARFMRLAFNIDMTDHPNFPATQEV